MNFINIFAFYALAFALPDNSTVFTTRANFSDPSLSNSYSRDPKDSLISAGKKVVIASNPSSGSRVKAVPGSIHGKTSSKNADASSVVSKRWLALGDSYTIGQTVDKRSRFPTQTATLLNTQGVKFKEPEFIAVTGWTTLNLQSAIASQSPKGKYDIVTLLIGVNDQYRRMDTAGYRKHFTQLLKKSICLANDAASHVIVVSIPDYSVTPFGRTGDTAKISREIDQFNAINYDVATKYHVQYLNITPSTREAKHDPSLLAYDGLHPSGNEYKKWANWLAPMVKAAVKKEN